MEVILQNKPELSTVKMNGLCPPLTVLAYFADRQTRGNSIECYRPLHYFSSVFIFP